MIKYLKDSQNVMVYNPTDEVFWRTFYCGFQKKYIGCSILYLIAYLGLRYIANATFEQFSLRKPDVDGVSTRVTANSIMQIYIIRQLMVFDGVLNTDTAPTLEHNFLLEYNRSKRLRLSSSSSSSPSPSSTSDNADEKKDTWCLVS